MTFDECYFGTIEEYLGRPLTNAEKRYRRGKLEYSTFKAGWDAAIAQAASDREAVGVAGNTLPMSLVEFQHRCQVVIGEEQEKANPDNHLIGLLCDAVRLARENETLAKGRQAIAAAKKARLHEAEWWREYIIRHYGFQTDLSEPDKRLADLGGEVGR